MSNLVKIGKYLEVEFVEKPGRKTDMWLVYSTRGDTLGKVEWFNRWRQYTFDPRPDTTFNAGCLSDIKDFLDKVNREHKEGRQ